LSIVTDSDHLDKGVEMKLSPPYGRADSIP
jgi:hypothetical protein